MSNRGSVHGRSAADLTAKVSEIAARQPRVPLHSTRASTRCVYGRPSHFVILPTRTFVINSTRRCRDRRWIEPDIRHAVPPVKSRQRCVKDAFLQTGLRGMAGGYGASTHSFTSSRAYFDLHGPCFFLICATGSLTSPELISQGVPPPLATPCMWMTCIHRTETCCVYNRGPVPPRESPSPPSPVVTQPRWVLRAVP